MSKKSIACIAVDGRKILVARRNPTGQMGDRWEFPGGKVEPGEDDHQAVVREMKEEFGMKVKPLEKIAETGFVHNGEPVSLVCYRIKVPHKGIFFRYRLTEHTDYDWVDVDRVPELNFVDSDLKLYPMVKEYVNKNGK